MIESPPTEASLLSEPVVSFEARELDNRGRFTLPRKARQGLSWLEPGGELLVVLGRHGRARILALAAAELEAQRKSLIDALRADDSESIDKLLVWRDRNRTVRVDRSGQSARLELPLDIILHLDAFTSAPPAPPPVVFVARCFEHVELWSRKYREERLQQAADDDDD